MGPYVLIGLRCLVAVVFAWSSVSKLRSRPAFAEFVAATGRLAPWPVGITAAQRLAALVAGLEVAVVPLLAVPATVPVGFGVAAALVLAFTAAIGLALRRGQRAPCRCFGSSRRPLGYPQLVRNGILLAVAASGVAGGLVTADPAAPAGSLLAVFAGAVAATAVVLTDDIAYLFRPSPTDTP